MVERDLAATTAAGSRTLNAQEWQRVNTAAVDFIAEGRHVLGPLETSNAALFTRHEALNDAVASLATAMFDDQVRAQKLGTETSRRRVRITAILLGVTLLLAIATAT